MSLPRLRSLIWILLVWTLAIAIPFRAAIFGGFDWLLGDRGDTLIEIAILEHWRNVFTGAAQWNATFYFDPHGGTLGYNDGNLLSGILYTVWRTLLDPFRSEILTAMTLKSIGFFGAYLLVARALRWGRGIALLIALLMAIANGMYVQSGHAQIQSLALLPWLAILVVGAWRAEMAGETRRAMLLAVGAVAVIGLWLMTAFYFAWFTLFFSAVLLLCWAGLDRRLNLSGLALLWRHRAVLGVAGAAFLLFATPFLAVYLPKVMETGGNRYVLSYLAHPTDTVNVGQGNLVWGWLFSALHWLVALLGGNANADTMLNGEHRSGFPLLLFALACAAAWQLLRQRGETGFARAFALAIMVSWALTLRFGPISPWILIHAIVPGAAGLRVVLRYQLFLVLPVLLLAAYVHRDRFAAIWRSRPALALVLVALLVAEQVNFTPVARLERPMQIADFAAIPAPPKDCTRFYLVSARRSEPLYVNAKFDGMYPHNADAMLLAELWRLPTLNGFSTFNPPDWNFADPRAANYDARVATYAKAHRLTGLCRLDMKAAEPWRQTLVE